MTTSGLSERAKTKQLPWWKDPETFFDGPELNTRTPARHAKCCSASMPDGALGLSTCWQWRSTSVSLCSFAFFIAAGVARPSPLFIINTTAVAGVGGRAEEVSHSPPGLAASFQHPNLFENFCRNLHHLWFAGPWYRIVRSFDVCRLPILPVLID